MILLSNWEAKVNIFLSGDFMVTGKYVNLYYKKYFWFFLLGVIALLAVDFFQLMIPEICGNIIDGVQASGEDSLFNKPELMRLYMIELSGIAFIMFAGRFTWRYCVFGTAAKIEGDLREAMFGSALNFSNQYYKEHKTGALMALFTNDLQTIRQAFGGGTVMLIDAIFLGAFSLVKMLMTNWILALFSLIPMFIMLFAALILGKIMKAKYTKRQEAYEKLSDFTQENFSGIAVIKAFVKEALEIKEFNKVNKNNYDKNIDYVRFSTLLDVLLNAFLATVMAVLFGGGAYFVITNANFFGQVFTTGKLFAFVGYFDTLIWPFLALSMLIQMKAQASASYKRIEEFMDTKVDIKDEDVEPIDSIKGKIEFRNLCFKYPDANADALSNISFTINEGEMVGIIGKTGCGKTTVVDLLLRTYNLKDGMLYIDDKDIMHLPFKKVRDSIGYVPQDNFLFSDTIKNNIAFAFDNESEEKIEEAAKAADVHSNIIEFTEKYETILGERGVTLSGGQKQRVSIARALIKDPAILIFDDSVSAVDTKTESTILDNLREIRRNKTTIMIAHRISTVETLDKIIVMDEGKVIAVGKHNELVNNCALYKEMVHLQELEKEVNGGEE